MADPDRIHKIMMPFWSFFVLYMVACVGITYLVTAVALSTDYVYESLMRIGGLPLLPYSPAAHGIVPLGVAIGGMALGVISLGGLSAGIVRATGIISVGGVAIGVVVLASVALGWREYSGLAVGRAALGALAVGNYGYAGTGAAYGSLEVSGRQKEHLIG